MSFSAGSIIGGLDFDVSGFAKGMLEVQTLTSLFPEWVTAFMANPMLGIISLAKDMGEAVVDAFKETLSITAEMGHKFDDVGEAAQKAGVSTEFLTAIGAAAADAGSSAEGLQDSLKFLNNNAADAADGGEVAKSFAQIGVSVTDSAGKLKSTQSLFLEVADAISRIEEPSKRTQAAMNLLGRGGNDMLALLSQGSAAIKEAGADITEFGGVVDEHMARVGDKFGTFSSTVTNIFDGLKESLALPVLDWVSDHMEEILNLVRYLDPAAKDLASSFGGLLVEGLNATLKVAEVLAPLLKDLLETMTAFTNLGGNILGTVGSGLSDLGVGDYGRPASSPTSAAAAGVTIQSVNVVVDADSQASEIAARLRPVVREAASQHVNAMTSAAAAAQVRRGL